jgi:hypothetical protein
VLKVVLHEGFGSIRAGEGRSALIGQIRSPTTRKNFTDDRPVFNTQQTLWKVRQLVAGGRERARASPLEFSE